MAKRTFPNIFAVLQDVKDELKGMKQRISQVSEPRRDIYEFSLFPGEASKIGDVSSYTPVTNEKGDTLLLPANQQSWLYRGQKEEYPNCLPKLYRDDPGEIELFLRRLQTTEFKLLLKTHPAVKDLEEKRFHVSFTGLAQHYGLKTELLDVTSDYRVAAFFAVCDYDREKECFYPISREGNEFGVFFKAPMITMNFPQGIFPDTPILEPIGLQPFPRPQAQRSYGCEVTEEKEFPAHKMKFRHSKEQSEKIFEAFNGGEDLLPNDPLTRKAQKIRESSVYSQKAFEMTQEEYEFPKSPSHYRRELRKIKERHQQKEPPVEFSDGELKRFKDNWEENKADFYDKILPPRLQYTGKPGGDK